MSIAASIDTIEARVPRRLSYALLAAAVALFGSVMLDLASSGLGYDLIPLSVAGRLVAAGHSAQLYAQDPHFYNRVSDPVIGHIASQAGFSSEPTPFVYPPLVAFAMQAMANVPFRTIARLWSWASAVLLLAGLHLVIAAYAPAWRFWRRPLAWALLLLALCAFEPIRYGFWLGQTTAIVFPLVAAALFLQRRGRLASAGFALALAAFIKLTPIVFAAIWIWRGPRRAAGWTVAFLALFWTISLAAMGPAVHAAYVDRVSAIGRIDVAAYNNHSLLAFISRAWFERSAWSNWQMWTPPPAALGITWLVVAAGALAFLWVLGRIPREQDATWRPLTEAAACLALLLVPNIAWTHYFVFLIPVIVALLAVGGDSTIVAMCAITFALCCRPVLAAQQELPSTASLLLISTPTIAAFVAALGVVRAAQERV